MDKVGEHGKGESVWLAFFLYDILQRFTKVSSLKNDTAFTEKIIKAAEELKNNINKNAWDGEWYRRAYFDDGTPLGSAKNEECKIDSIAQSWSVLSGAGEDDRKKKAMLSAYEYLVRKEEGIIQLFDPPFDKGTMNPGYIKGYLPGVRENGGQYTHAAIWLVMGFAALKDKEHTWELLDMINPLNHGIDEDTITQYKVEPYVMAADIYGENTNRGRGGWTWYTGSAGWMYQMITTSFLGLQREGNVLHIKPCIPVDWPSVRINYRYIDTLYIIEIYQDKSVSGNDTLQSITLENDGQAHHLKILLN
jgi:cellobiose phosphorylase